MVKGSLVQFCRKGHDKDVTGRYKDGKCVACTKEANKSRYIPVLIDKRKIKKQFCVNNHDVFVCGRDAWGECKDCGRLEARERYKLLVEGSLQVEHEQFCNKGHDIFIFGRNKYGSCIICINERHKERMQLDINYKLKFNLRNRLYQAIKKNWKIGSAVRDLGCPIPFFKDYISFQFKDGMTWDNWGSVWELDHIDELHTFDLKDPVQFKQAVHYTNLQPLTIPDHKRKTALK